MSIRKYLLFLPFFITSSAHAMAEQTEIYEPQKNFTTIVDEPSFQIPSFESSTTKPAPVYFAEDEDDIALMIEEMNKTGELNNHHGPKKLSKLKEFIMKHGGRFFVRCLELRNYIIAKLYLLTRTGQPKKS